jgi:hypothetical protein
MISFLFTVSKSSFFMSISHKCIDLLEFGEKRIAVTDDQVVDAAKIEENFEYYDSSLHIKNDKKLMPTRTCEEM